MAVVAEAFLHHEARKVDKDACINFRGNRSETKPSLIGCEVEISYDPMKPEIITVHYRGMEPFTSSPLKIGQYYDSKPSFNASAGSRNITHAGCT